MKIEELDDYKGQAGWRIETETAVYVYHRYGGGFASLVDGEGNDWISYEPRGGSDGRYRGIPNIIHPEGGFHPGAVTCESRIDEGAGVIRSDSRDGLWSGQWRMTETRADFLLMKAGHPYWFLYEGTPAGCYDEESAVLMDSSGRIRPCSTAWEERLPEPRWVVFLEPRSPFGLVVADRSERAAEVVDSFWSMERNMTVFGFGRLRNSRDPRWMHLTAAPAAFTVALLRPGNAEDTVKGVNALLA